MTAMHTEFHPHCKVTYWNSVGAVKSDDEWTYCRVSLIGLYPCDHEFNNAHDRDRFLSFMDGVFERGRSAAKQEIREMLGV